MLPLRWMSFSDDPVALALEKILGKSVVVDNRAGAGGMLGNAAVARSEPDGAALNARAAKPKNSHDAVAWSRPETRFEFW